MVFAFHAHVREIEMVDFYTEKGSSFFFTLERAF